MIKLKDFVDFITSLVEMDEVKEGKFVLPTVLEFNLERYNHRQLKKEVIEVKEGTIVDSELGDPFEIDILGITLKFEHTGYE